MWFRFLEPSVNNQIHISIESPLGNWLDRFPTAISAGTSHVTLANFNIFFQAGSTYWIKIEYASITDPDEQYYWTKAADNPAINLPRAYKIDGGEWQQAGLSAPGGFAIGVTEIPEPSTAILLLLGVAGLSIKRVK